MTALQLFLVLLLRDSLQTVHEGTTVRTKKKKKKILHADVLIELQIWHILVLQHPHTLIHRSRVWTKYTAAYVLLPVWLYGCITPAEGYYS